MTGLHGLATSVRGLDPGLHVQDTGPLWLVLRAELLALQDRLWLRRSGVREGRGCPLDAQLALEMKLGAGMAQELAGPQHLTRPQKSPQESEEPTMTEDR